MLIGPAIRDTDPIRQRYPSHGGYFVGNILSEAMRGACVDDADRHVRTVPVHTMAKYLLLLNGDSSRGLLISASTWKQDLLAASDGAAKQDQTCSKEDKAQSRDCYEFRPDDIDTCAAEHHSLSKRHIVA